MEEKFKISVNGVTSDHIDMDNKRPLVGQVFGL